MVKTATYFIPLILLLTWSCQEKKIRQVTSLYHLEPAFSLEQIQSAHIGVLAIQQPSRGDNAQVYVASEGFTMHLLETMKSELGQFCQSASKIGISSPEEAAPILHALGSKQIDGGLPSKLVREQPLDYLVVLLNWHAGVWYEEKSRGSWVNTRKPEIQMELVQRVCVFDSKGKMVFFGQARGGNRGLGGSKNAINHAAQDSCNRMAYLMRYGEEIKVTRRTYWRPMSQ